MKIRNGFVSNSSSSSFLINKKDLTELQIYLIVNDTCLEEGFDDGPWYIFETKETVQGSTTMDNFSMMDYFDKLGVPSHVITWDD